MARQARCPAPQILRLTDRSAGVRADGQVGKQNKKRIPREETTGGLLAAYLTAAKGHSNESRKRLLCDRIIASAGRKTAASIQPADLAGAVASYNDLAPWTRYQACGQLRRIITYLQGHGAKAGLEKAVPKIAVPSPRNITCSVSNRDKMADAAPLYLRLFILLCSDLAIRSGTVTTLAPKHYDAATGTLTFRTKFDGAQSLPVTGEVRKILDAVGHRDLETPFVAQLHKNHKIGQCQLQASFQRLRKSLGIKEKFIPHDLRRSTAVRAYEQTKDLRVVQRVLGHKALRSTLHYLDHHTTEVTPAMLEAMATRTERRQ